MRYFLFLLFLLLVQNGMNAQQGEQFSRVKIDLTQHEITAVSQLGLEADHGHYAPGKHLTNDYSASEIQLLRDNGIPFTILIEDVKKWYREQKAVLPAEARAQDCIDGPGLPVYDYETPVNYDFGSMGGYLTYEEFLAQLDLMFEKYPNLITAKAPIADFKTQEDRSIYWLRISDNAAMDEDEPEVFYNAVHHAREPNSLSQTIFYMWYLLENYDDNPEVKFLVDETEMYFVPMINPDGYIYNQTQDPTGGGLWRKNRWVDNGNAVGVDLNRNYGFEWGYDNNGSSPNPGSQTYRGTAPFSEPETQAIKYFCENHKFLITLNCHTYSNLLIHPWGYEDFVTDEDLTYKAMGQVMIAENDFALGTGFEVLGYLTNGDSDDWMHGETTTKDRIFSYTPEVGPASIGFWPASSEIDLLNKSGARMNLNMASLVHNYLRVEDLTMNIISTEVSNLRFYLQHAGLEPGINKLTVTSDDPDISFETNSIDLDFVHLEELIINIPFVASSNLTSPREVTFELAIDNGSWIRKESFTKLIAPNSLSTGFYSEMDNLNGFEVTGDWWLTMEEFVSAATSLTDSPGGNYSPNRDDYAMLNTPSDLSDALSAQLVFEAQWDIENDYDFVQVLAGTSADINQMTPLCGKYTNPGSNNQLQGEPLYDGVQPAWVSEEMDLSDFIGEEEVYFAFRFFSDQGVEADGFYVDNLVVYILRDEDVATEEVLENFVSVFPNPTNDIINITQKNTESAHDLIYEVKDILGIHLLSKAATEKVTSIDLSQFAPGVYILEAKQNGDSLGSMRIVRE